MIKWLSVLFLVGCSSPAMQPECMPPEAIYTQYMSVTSGFCPEIPPTLVTLTDGVYPIGDGVTCKEEEQLDCSVKQHNCSYRFDNCEIISNTKLDFSSDGKEAKGFISVTILCDGQFRCAGTYDVKLELNK